LLSLFFRADSASPEISPLSLHDALPIFASRGRGSVVQSSSSTAVARKLASRSPASAAARSTRSCAGSSSPARLATIAQPRQARRSEEHTSELQSPDHLVCRLLLEKKNHR